MCATCSVEDLAGDLIGVIAAQRAGRTHVVGLSLGGYVGQLAALIAPDRVASLTLIGAEPLGWDGPQLPHIASDFLDHFATLTDLDWSDREAALAFLTGVARLCAGSARPFDAGAARAEAAAVLARTASPGSAFNHATVDTRGEWTAAFRHIAQPVLVLHGDEDRYSRSQRPRPGKRHPKRSAHGSAQRRPQAARAGPSDAIARLAFRL